MCYNSLFTNGLGKASLTKLFPYCIMNSQHLCIVDVDSNKDSKIYINPRATFLCSHLLSCKDWELLTRKERYHESICQTYGHRF